MGKLRKKIFFILEITISFVLAIFFSIKIINLLYVSVPYPQVKNNSIYLRGSVNKRYEKFTPLEIKRSSQDNLFTTTSPVRKSFLNGASLRDKSLTGFTNLIGFDYRKFLVHFPGWHNHDFSGIINSHSLIITSYSLSDFTSLLLRMHFPYWQKGGVKISFKIGGRWYTFKDFIELKDKDYSLDDILFLGLGMENVDSRSISEKDFLDGYFKGRKMAVRDNFLRRMRGEVIVKLTLK